MHNTINTPEGIEYFQMLSSRGALKLEMLGMKRHGRSAYSIIKEVYGFRGNRENVLNQLETLINQTKENLK